MAPPLLQSLISSKTRVKLLTLFFTRPGERFYGRELQRLLGLQPRSVHRELQRLEAAGLLLTQDEGRVKYYSTNLASPIYPELRSLILKTTGLGDALRASVRSLGKVQHAFLFGSAATGYEIPGSDIDLMIVGDPDLGEVSKMIAKIEHGLGRPVNYLIFSREEIEAKLRNKEAFAVNAFTRPRVMLLGVEDDLPKP